MKRGIILAIFLIVSFTGLAASTIYVPDDFGAIQEAIDAAVGGDTIIVRPGTYVEHIDLSGKAITLKSEKGPWVTTIKFSPEEYTVVDCISGEGPDTVLEGFQILGPGYPWQNKLGMRNVGSSPTVTNVFFKRNSIGMHNGDNSNPTVSDCLFDGNGTGIRSSASSPSVVNTLLYGNTTGMFNQPGSNPVIRNSTFLHNGGDGGGMHNITASPTIINCTFRKNGGMGHPGSALANVEGSFPVITNSILYENWMGILIYDDYLSQTTVTYSNVEEGWPGTGNIDADPLWATSAIPYVYDQHLTFDSPCRNAGDNSAIVDGTDHEGDPRIADGTVDMGADEFYTHLYFRAFLDWLQPGAPVEVVLVGTPGTQPVMLAVGSGVLEDPISTPWGEWWNEWWLEFPIIGPFHFGSIPSDGIFVFTATLPPDIPGPYSNPMQAFIGDSLTNHCIMEVH